MRTRLAFAQALTFAFPAAAQDLPALFRQGMEAVKAGEHDRAIAAFREMLVADPSLVRVRLELARAFCLKGEDRLAKRHFEAVLAGNPPRPSSPTSAASRRRYGRTAAGTCMRASRSRPTPTSGPAPMSGSSTSTSVGRGCRSPAGFTLGVFEGADGRLGSFVRSFLALSERFAGQ